MVKVYKLSENDRIIIAFAVNTFLPDSRWIATPSTLYNFAIEEIRTSLEWLRDPLDINVNAKSIERINAILEAIKDQ